MAATNSQVGLTIDTLRNPPLLNVATNTTVGFKASYTITFKFSKFSGFNNSI